MSQWYHAQDGRQNGPVSEDELRALVSSGRLGPDDLVWCDGMAEWVAVKTLPQLAPQSSAAIPPPPAATNPYQAPASPMMAPSTFNARGGGDVDLGEALSLGWKGFVDNAVMGSVATLLFGVIYMGLAVFSIIPFVSLIVQVFVTYPLLAGMFYLGIVAADNARGNPRQVNVEDLFLAFRVSYWQAVLYGVIFLGVTLVASFAIGLPLAMLLPAAEENPTTLIVAVLVLMIPLMYLSLRFWFGLHFLVDKRLKAVDALGATWNATRGQVLYLLVFSLLIGAISIVGMLLLMIGLIPAGFLCACIAGAIYRQIAGD